MKTMMLFNGRELQVPETEQEWLDLQPEAKLRRLFDGDEAATMRFHDRMRDLDRRFDAWAAVRPVLMGATE